MKIQVFKVPCTTTEGEEGEKVISLDENGKELIPELTEENINADDNFKLLSQIAQYNQTQVNETKHMGGAFVYRKVLVE